MVYGGKTLDSFYYQEELKDAFGDNYIRCCTQKCSENLYQGRVTSYLSEQENLPANYKYFICGMSEMVVETRDILIAKGVPFDNIIAEIYF